MSSATDADGRRPKALDRVLGDRALVLLRNQEQERAARETDDLVYTAFDAVNNLVVVTDVRLPDNPLVIVNQNFLDTTGYAREEVVGRNCRFLQVRGDGTRDDAGDGQDEALDKIRTAVERGGATEVVLRNYRKDGALFYNRLYLTPVRNGAGEVTHFVGVQNDVTEEVERAREADGQRRLLRSFFDSAPLLMGVLEASGDGLRLRTANAATLRLLKASGADVDAVEGRELAELGFTEREVETWAHHVRECATTGEPVHFSTTFPWEAAEGGAGVRALDVVVNAVGRDDALFSYVVEDVTDRRAAEAERRLLAATVEQAAESILVTGPGIDAPGPEILYANEAHARMFGYTLDEIVGRTPRMYQGPETDRAVLDRIRRRLEAGESVQAETVNYRKDGTPFVLEWEIAPVRDDAGEITNWVGTQRDVTERRRLEHEVLEVTGREQERMAREIHDGLGQVLTGVSIKLAVLERALAASGERALAADAGRSAELVAEALDQARAISRGLFPVAIEPDGIDAALDRLVNEAEKDLDIACSFEAADPVAAPSSEAAGHLYRIAQEALTNAVRHGRAHHVQIALARGDAQTATLTVRDDGDGITDGALEGAGGLGLRTMAYRARRIGGVLDVQRAADGGTVVRVRFTPGGAAAPPQEALVADGSVNGATDGRAGGAA